MYLTSVGRLIRFVGVFRILLVIYILAVIIHIAVMFSKPGQGKKRMHVSLSLLPLNTLEITTMKIYLHITNI